MNNYVIDKSCFYPSWLFAPIEEKERIEKLEERGGFPVIYV